MIDKEALCALALAAIDSADARTVLADALEETGWWDPRCMGEPRDGIARMYLWEDNGTWRIVRRGDRSCAHAKAVAAVLLFGDLPTSWPLAERCRWWPDYREDGSYSDLASGRLIYAMSYIDPRSR